MNRLTKHTSVYTFAVSLFSFDSPLRSEILQVLAMAGIDMEGFHAAPSTRSLLSSLAEVTGVSLTDIIKQGHWSQTSTFQKFYRKNAKECDSNFQSGILNKQL